MASGVLSETACKLGIASFSQISKLSPSIETVGGETSQHSKTGMLIVVVLAQPLASIKVNS